MRERSRIWFAFLGGAVAWTFHLMGGYGLSEGFCRSGLAEGSFLGLGVMIWGLGLLTLVAIAVTVAALWVSRQLHVATVGSVAADQTGNNLFMARSSLLNNILFLAVIIAQSFPIFILGRNC